jgi:hypothetical protein
MANKNKKVKRWSQAEEDILIKNVEKNVLCLHKAFEQTALEIQRSPGAVAARWYQYTSKNCGTKFATISGRHVASNRKNSKGKPLKLSIFKKILSLLGLKY